MNIIPVESGPLATMCYLAFDPQASTGIIIDAPMDSVDVFSSLAKKNEIKIQCLILTHSHWDHTADAYAISQALDTPIFIHKDDEYRLLNPNEHSIMPLPFELVATRADKYLNHKDTIKCGNITLEIRHTPGHTEGSVCIVSHDDKTVFTGDTLFMEGIGRVDLPGGSWGQINESIESQLSTLADDYSVHCGHGPSTSIGHEKKYNPFISNNNTK